MWQLVDNSDGERKGWPMVFKIIRKPTSDAERDYNRLARQLNRRLLAEPGPDQHVGECHWSKTGWAIWENNGGCTCAPTKAPEAK